MVVELQRRGVDMFVLSDPRDENSFLIATRHQYSYKLDMRKRAGPRHEKQLWLWEKDTSASNHFTNGGLFAIRLAGTPYYLSLPNDDDPQAGFNMLELKLALLKPIELVCEAVQWEETDGGVIRKPAVRPRPRVIN